MGGRPTCRSAATIPRRQAMKYSRALQLLALTFALGSVSFEVNAAPHDKQLCSESKGDESIAACTRAITSGQFRGYGLSALYAERGRLFYDREEFEKAYEDHNHALDLNPRNSSALNGRGLYFQKKDKLEQAINDYSKSIEIDPNYRAPYINRGNVFRDLGQYEKAISDYTKSISLEASALAYTNRANTYVLIGSNEQAARDFNNAIRIDPNYAYAYTRRADFYRGLGKYDQAIADYTRAIQLNPANAFNFNGRGLTFFYREEYSRALLDFNKASEISPDLQYPYLNRGRVHAKTAAYDQAINEYDKAIALSPKYTDAYIKRGNAYMEKGVYSRALADYAKAIELNPKDATPFNDQGNIFLARGEFDKAVASYSRAIELDPKFAIAHRNRGLAFASQLNDDAAKKDFDTAINTEPKYAAALVSRGILNERQGRHDQAVTDFKATLSLKNEPGIAGPQRTARERLAALLSSEPTTPEQTPPQNLPAPTSQAKQVQRTDARRIALVIGNSAYRSVPTLPNPRSDAEAVASSLRQVGFQSIKLVKDLTREQLLETLRGFALEAEESDWAVIYFAGHGIEMAGTNFLVPVDAKLSRDRDLNFEAVPLDHAITAVEGAKKLRLVMVDACRENPFDPNMKRTVASRSIGRGLAQVEPAVGSLVVYAAKHGQTALDGEKNSPFASAFVRHVARPGLEINKLFRLVRDDVLDATARKQEPFTYGSLPGREDFYFISE
jgi:tetratricopeptide (TPR) repeat protein